MKKNFINPEIKISLFNQERVQTDIQVGEIPAPIDGPMPSDMYNYNAAVKWLESKNINKVTNIISFRE